MISLAFEHTQKSTPLHLNLQNLNFVQVYGSKVSLTSDNLLLPNSYIKSTICIEKWGVLVETKFLGWLIATLQKPARWFGTPWINE